MGGGDDVSAVDDAGPAAVADVVEEVDEDHPRVLAPGRLVTVHDSGKYVGPQQAARRLWRCCSTAG